MYTFRLQNFEGPLDLLLFFIKRDELDIYDIPISRITHEFLEYVRIMKLLDLELAGEFLVMAATLLEIKVKMLLPRPELENGEQYEDPRTPLVLSLVEYAAFKEASIVLAEKVQEQRYIHYREYFEVERDIAFELSDYKNATLFDLIKAFKKVMTKNIPIQTRTIQRRNITPEEKMQEILLRLHNTTSIRFFETIDSLELDHLIATFLAILELVKDKKIRIMQNNLFDDVVIYKITKEELEEEEMEILEFLTAPEETI